MPFVAYVASADMYLFAGLAAAQRSHVLLLPACPVATLQETTLALTQHDKLLEVLLGTLLQVLRRGLNAAGQLDGDSPEISGEWPGLALLLVRSPAACGLRRPALPRSFICIRVCPALPCPALHAPAGRLYLRTAADLHMCLSHPAVVLQLLGGPQAPLFTSHFLEVFRLIQGASPVRCAPGQQRGALLAACHLLEHLTC